MQVRHEDEPAAQENIFQFLFHGVSPFCHSIPSLCNYAPVAHQEGKEKVFLPKRYIDPGRTNGQFQRLERTTSKFSDRNENDPTFSVG